MGFAETLTLIFVVLKVLGVLATWSWWTVFSPMLVVYGILALVGFFWLAMSTLIAVLD